MSRRKAILLAIVLSFGLLLTVFAVKLADGTLDGSPQPAITASPDVKLHEPEPTVSADPEAKLPDQPKPVVETVPAPADPVPFNIPAPQYVSSPPSGTYYIPLVPAPVVPLPAPQQPPVAPNIPSLVQPLPPVVREPVRGLVGPLTPILKPLLPPVVHPITDPLLK